ncbi:MULTISPECIES: DUF3299 domain-containing protein [unclassified Limnohabitans]|uniref:DUF3299 domain-containing protein n=2 Tax=Limnohabitans TaxID=665874 RepID=UPI000DD29558|nr:MULTISPECIES: DUF3299 domain-containing protein [unclassified Limnohabitans]PUE38234.1 hypothetical protein B9Z34_12215 [Limnohabitans sp. Hippo3]
MNRNTMMKAGLCAWALWLTGQAVAQSVRDTVRETVPQVQPALSGEAPPPGASVPGPTRTIGWEQLIPAGWDPYKDLKALNLDGLKDNDPKAEEALKKMRKMWDNAPINPLILGQSVRLPGYMVPLEDLPEGTKEFLLVPYFGACVHSPPPPANQIVHVVLDKPTKRFRLMDTLWVTGPLSATKTDSHMGVSSYRIDAKQVTPFAEKK